MESLIRFSMIAYILEDCIFADQLHGSGMTLLSSVMKDWTKWLVVENV